MSRSQPRLTSPVTRIFEWSGSTGELKYYDREKQVAVGVNLPFEFLVLDQLACVTGFSKNAKARIWSNELRPEDLKTEPIIVQTKGEQLYNGIYTKGMGGGEYGYTQAVYLMFLNKETGNYEIGKFMAAGAARGAWFDFRKGKNVEEGKVLITGRGDEEKNGATTFYRPTFEWKPSDKQENDIAIRMDRIVQEYLRNRFKADRAERETGVPINNDIHTTTDDRVEEFDSQPMDDAEFDSLLASGGSSPDINPDDLPLSFRN